MSSNATETAIDESPELGSSLIVGIMYTVLPLVLLVVYVIFNVVLHTNNEYRKLTAFRLMFYSGILDCLQLICHTFSGFLTLWPSINTRIPYLNQIMGATINSAWVSLFPLSMITSLYRLLIIRKVVDPSSAFPLLVKCGVLLTFTYSFAVWTCLLTFARIVYYPRNWFWSFANREAFILSQTEIFISVPIITLTFMVYIAIAVTIYRMTDGVRIGRTELLLIIHAAILFLVLTTIIVFWNYCYYLFPNSEWTMFAINLLWMIYCGLNPLLYMAFSKNIRQSFLQFIHVTAKRNVITVSNIAMKANR